MITGLYYQISTGKWLHRIDHGTVSSQDASRAECGGGFGIPSADVGIVDAETLTEADRDALRLAVDWSGTPPGLPSPSDTDNGGMVRPSPAALALEEQRRLRIAEIGGLSRSNWTTAQMRELIDLLAQEVTR
jgi:hypothetical protein